MYCYFAKVLTEKLQWLVYTALGLRVLVDIALAGILILYLQRSRTGFKGSVLVRSTFEQRLIL